MRDALTKAVAYTYASLCTFACAGAPPAGPPGHPGLPQPSQQQMQQLQQQQQMLQLQHSLQQAQQHQQMAGVGLANQQSGPPQLPNLMSTNSGLSGPAPPQQQPFAMPPAPSSQVRPGTLCQGFQEPKH